LDVCEVGFVNFYTGGCVPFAKQSAFKVYQIKRKTNVPQIKKIKNSKPLV